MTPITIDDLQQQLRAAIDADNLEQINLIGAELDTMQAEQQRRQPEPDPLAGALWYAEQGLHVFALQPGAKIPHKGTRGCKDATADPDTIRAWWDRWPGSNVGIATGHLVDVIDIDGLKGQISYGQNVDAFTNLQVLGMACTPRPGGLHLFIPATGQGNRAGILPGIDHRGAGGYVVAPPSSISDAYAAEHDCHAGPYTFLGQLDLTAAEAAA